MADQNINGDLKGTKEDSAFPKLPEIKHERVSDETIEKIKITDDKGKKHDAKSVSFTEKEIDSVHLTKISPLFYFCPDNNKVLLIPFSIQFSPTEILKLAAGLAHNLEKALKELNQTQENGQKTQ